MSLGMGLRVICRGVRTIDTHEVLLDELNSGEIIGSVPPGSNSWNSKHCVSDAHSHLSLILQK